MADNSLLRLRITNETPPGGYRFTCPVDGYRVGPEDNRENWIKKVYKHYRDNDYPLPDNLTEIAEDQLSRILPTGWGFYSTGEQFTDTIDARLKGSDILNGTKVMLELVRKVAAFKLFGLESPFVSQEVATERALICSRCCFNIPITGCFGCSGISDVIEGMSGGYTTPYDDMMQSCGCCKCSNKAQVRVEGVVLKEGVTEEMLRTFPKWCWKPDAVNATVVA